MTRILNILLIFLFAKFCNADVGTFNKKLISYSAGENIELEVGQSTYLSGYVKIMHNSARIKESEKELVANEWIGLDAVHGWYIVVPVNFKFSEHQLTLTPISTRYIDLNQFYHLRRSENFRDWTYPIKNEKWILPFYGVSYNISKEFEVFEILISEEEIDF